MAKLGGGGLLTEYQGSLPKILSVAYPTVDWKLWIFSQVPKNLWNDEKNIVAYLTWLSEQLGIVQKDDWKHVSTQQINPSLLQKFGGIQNLISTYFPGVEVKTQRKDGTLSKAQHRLTQVVKKLFPAEGSTFSCSAHSFRSSNQLRASQAAVPFYKQRNGTGRFRSFFKFSF